MDYVGICEELQVQGVELLSVVDVVNVVIVICCCKLFDLDVLGNVGSFFKNLVLLLEQVDVLLQYFFELLVFLVEQDGKCKVLVVWMIEFCGWKGFCEGDVGVVLSYVLVLVNYGNVSGVELLVLVCCILVLVLEKFGVLIELEFCLFGVQW